jgi:integrase
VAGIFDTYTETLTPGSKEANTVETEAVHGRHFKRVLGLKREFDSLSIEILQRYVDKRAGEGVARATISKEMSTLRVVWGWALKRGHVKSALTWKMSDLTLPKETEKAPFQTWEQITRKIERGGLTDQQKAELWEALWLDQRQTEECLGWVREHARRSVIHPMFAVAAYTGARRSEIIRSEVDDWDFESGLVTIRQKKADKSKSFTRRNVPIHPQLAGIIKAYLENHPGGPWVFCTADGLPITPQLASKFLRTTLEGGKWSVLHGWHTFRHSLASNMASAAVDQRIINEILGHSTEDMERRYRHLLPRKTEHALHSLFGTEATS